MSAALWISEQEVVDLISLPEAIDALADAFPQLHEGGARNMAKTHVMWGEGDTLHAIGAVFPAFELVATKSWAHTEGGATPLLLMWNSHTGALQAIIEAFALGQMRTAAVSGLATRTMAKPDADSFAIIGTGKQAMAQIAAVAAVRTIRDFRVFSPTPAKRAAFVRAVNERGFGFEAVEKDSAEAASDGAAIVTLATRAREPFFSARMAAQGAHINAVGAVTPERQEFNQDLFTRAGWVVTDEPDAALRLSSEFGTWFGAHPDDDFETIAAVVAAAKTRPIDCDISLFKAMGMGASDLAVGREILARARSAGVGKPLPAYTRSAPRLTRAR